MSWGGIQSQLTLATQPVAVKSRFTVQLSSHAMSTRGVAEMSVGGAAARTGWGPRPSTATCMSSVLQAWRGSIATRPTMASSIGTQRHLEAVAGFADDRAPFDAGGVAP